MDEYIKRAAIMEFPIRKDHCDKERANEHFIFGIESVLEYVENLPAADVAPVVRCKDCASTRKKDDYESVYLDYEVLICTNCEYGWQAVWPNHFCGYGKRKDEAQNER